MTGNNIQKNLKNSQLSIEHQLSALIENQHESILFFDANFQLINFNSIAAKRHIQRLGIELKKGKTVAELAPANKAKKWIDRSKRCLNGEQITRIHLTTIEGTLFQVEENFIPIKEGEKILGFLFKGKEETLRSITEKTFEQSEKILGDLGDKLPIVVSKLIVTPEGKAEYIYLSKDIEQVYEVPRENAYKDIDILRNMVHHKDENSYFEAFKEATNTLSVFVREKRIVTSSGEIKWLKVRAIPKKIKDGSTLWDLITMDISSIKAFEKKINDNQTFFQNIADNVPGLIMKYKMDAEGNDKIIFVSKKGIEKLWEVSIKEAYANTTHIWKKIHEEDRSLLMNSIIKSRDTLEDWQFEYRMIMNDGKVKWNLGVGVPQKQKDGSVIWDTLILDITEEKEFFIQKEKLLKDLKEYAHLTSHKIRGPLSRIMGLTELLVEKLINPEEFQQYALLIKDASKEMDNMIKTMNNVLSRTSYFNKK